MCWDSKIPKNIYLSVFVGNFMLIYVCDCDDKVG